MIRYISLFLLAVGMPELAWAQSVGLARTFTAYLENDIFGGTDKHYTNAVKFIWISKDLEQFGDDTLMPSWLREAFLDIPYIKSRKGVKNIALSLGQNIYTPDDIQTTNLIVSDRPYAGYTYLAAGFHAKNDFLLDTFELTLGMVGPSSLAEKTQKWVHENITGDDPNGWDNQLRDELGIMVSWQRSWRVFEGFDPFGSSWDVLSHAGVTLGNIFTFTNTGFEIRYGENLPVDFGYVLIGPGGGTSAPASDKDPRTNGELRTGWHLFLRLEGRIVGRDIFLDGNTWKSSHRVTKKPLVGDFAAGVSIVFHGLKFTYTQVYRTDEFEGQLDEQYFGSVSLAFTY